MGQRGPAQQPTKIVELRGNPGHRTNRSEPKARKRRPSIPPIIAGNKEAMVHYHKLVKLTESMDLLREPDGMALGKLAQFEADYDKITAQIRRRGNLITNKKTGMLHINPLLKRQGEIVNMIWRAYRDFGFTPSARAGLRTEPSGKPADNEADWSGF
ncbi:MAG TPA: P27 family phage terminase small subunit [Hyphomicrobiaceae bacterium]|nr:P27 family phage terminase small subunit [Hyphomicrobiaceae bacterium]